MTENSATIALKGDPSNLLSALGMGTAKTQDFSNKANKSIANVKKSTDALTQSTLSNAAAVAKDAAAWAMFAAQFTKVSTIYATVEMAITATGYALENTGKSLKTFDERLEGAKKILQECGGDVDLINERLLELGVTADEAGIKVENNLTRIQDGFKKLLDTVTNSDTPLKDASSAWEKWLEALRTNTEQDMKTITDSITNAFDGLRQHWVAARDQVSGLLQETDKHAEHVKQTDAELRAYQEKIAKDNKVNEIKRTMYAADYEAFDQYYRAKMESARRFEVEQEVATERDVKQIEKRIEAANKELIRLRDLGRLRTEQGAAQMHLNDALLEQQQKLFDKAKNQQKLDEELARNIQTVTTEINQERESVAALAASYGQLTAMVADAKEEVEDLAERGLAGTEEARAALDKMQALERQAERARLAGIARENAAKEDAIRREANLKRSLKENKQNVEDTTTDAKQEKELRALELQGASARQLHEQRMKYIREEEALTLSRLEVQDPEQIERIKAAAEMRRIREVARFEQQKVDETESLRKARREQAWFAEEERMNKLGYSERQYHELSLRRIRERAQEEAREASTAAEHVALMLKMQQAITEEEKRFLHLKKDGVNVDVNQKTGKPVADTRTRKQRNDQLKASIAAGKKSQVLAKKAAANEKFIKQQKARTAKENSQADTKAENLGKAAKAKAEAEARKAFGDDDNSPEAKAERRKDNQEKTAAAAEEKKARLEQFKAAQEATRQAEEMRRARLRDPVEAQRAKFNDAVEGFKAIKDAMKNDRREDKNSSLFSKMNDRLRETVIGLDHVVEAIKNITL